VSVVPATGESPVVRVGAVSYLNAWPLTYFLPRFAPAAQISVDVPSRLAEGLRSGRFDVAMVPSIEYTRNPGASIVADVCIASDGAVRSVRLHSRVPLDQVRSLALDEGSRTSAALARIWLKERWNLAPELQPPPIGAAPDASPADAIMLIGDRGMKSPGGGFRFEWDLGREWTRWTGLPFVFALWVARPGAQLDGLDAAMAQARDEGLRHLDEISRRASAALDIPEDQCLTYLRDHLEFQLGPRQQSGLRRFYNLAAKHGLTKKGAELVFYHRRAAG
jgi:chorismate dehydratase